MTLQELLFKLRTDLPGDAAAAMRDLRLLAAHALGIERSRVTLHLHDPVTQPQIAALQRMAALRAAHMPVSKIIGERAFWGRDFTVSCDVLDPRPETEVLIEACLQLDAPRRVLDLGTGSGAIAITLAAHWPQANLTASDISGAALDVARANALRHSVEIEFIQSDWFDRMSGRFDLIVSNPPYIAAGEMAQLSAEVRDYDPHLALSDGADGLSAYRILTAHSGDYLMPGGWLMVEIGWTQGAEVLRLFEQAGFEQCQTKTDLDGRDRVVCGRWPQ